MIPRPLRSGAGFTYIGVLAMVIIMGIMLGKAAGYWKTRMQREREIELIFRGTQYRDALRRWYNIKPTVSGTAQPPGTAAVQPTTLPPGSRKLNELKDLLQGSDVAKVRYLRKLYLDPMTGKEFDVVRDANQQIIGVKSTSEAEPIKQANFPLDFNQADFEGKKKYNEWQFICTRWPQPAVNGGVKGLDNPNGPNVPAPTQIPPKTQ